jgi:hypothetical protein
MIAESDAMPQLYPKQTDALKNLGKHPGIADLGCKDRGLHESLKRINHKSNVTSVSNGDIMPQILPASSTNLVHELQQWP